MAGVAAGFIGVGVFGAEFTDGDAAFAFAVLAAGETVGDGFGVEE